jgi:hypothetical protein
MSEFEKLGEALERKGVEVEWSDEDRFYLLINFTDVDGQKCVTDILVEQGRNHSASVELFDYLRQADDNGMMEYAVKQDNVHTVAELIEYIDNRAHCDGMELPLRDLGDVRVAADELSSLVSGMEQDMKNLVSLLRDYLKDANERRIMRRPTPARNRYRR